MAINFTNKYMQVFQNYNEFGEHSADYVRGEDHIAFLIEENEVIYWLYLEQVWRPLNVRTTTTGELEDGRTKIAVRLEYVEGGQKYTSVPNIPDPERITSMSRFLEDYPDIEEVNVSGTVNLTDLSYAFAGSKIKDFSMLDTSNVENINHFIDNIDSENLNVYIEYKISNIDSVCYIENIKLNNLEFNALNVNNAINIANITANKIISNNQMCSFGDYGNAKINEIESNDTVYIQSGNGNNKLCKINNINSDVIYVEPSGLVDDNILNIIFNNLIIRDTNFNSYNWKNKIICLSNNNVCNIAFEFDYTQIYNFSFGYGIDYSLLPNANLAVKDDRIIGNFIFTVPIVNDDFYNKYSNANKISIFQYKTTFTEIADVKITSATDSNLIYVNWNSIDFDTSDMSIEFYNIDNDDLLYINTTLLHFKKFIADNTNISFDVNNKYDNKLTAILNITADEGYISGNYNTYNGFNLIINDLYKNINIYNAYRVILDKNITDDRNIKIYAGDVYGGRVNEEQVIITDIDFDEEIININSFVHDNKLLFGIESQWSNLNKPTLAPIANYIDGLEIYIDDTGDSLNAFYNYFLNSKENNPIHIGTRRTYKSIDTFNFHYVNINKYKDNIENIYLDMGDYVYLAPNLYNDNGILKNIFNIINIKGVVNIVINLYNSIAMNTPITNNETSLRHIDINKTFCDNSSNHILYYKYCDDETNTNLITKLIDNTRNSIKTIYMYRSQANIIGEENIAAAVAKNYEFAIIEN